MFSLMLRLGLGTLFLGRREGGREEGLEKDGVLTRISFLFLQVSASFHFFSVEPPSFSPFYRVQGK